jgi:imidazolonepropionase-like amidohydrolase
VKLLLDRKIYAAVQPRTMKRLAYDVSQAESGTNPRRRGKERLQTMHENEVKLLKAGVPLLLATDAGPTDPDRAEAMSPAARDQRPTAWGDAHFLWLEAMVEKGMKPMDAILAGTRNIAAAYKRLDKIGTIEQGKMADLLILDADPLADVSNVRRISSIIKDGKVVDRDSLPLTKVLSLPRK